MRFTTVILLATFAGADLTGCNPSDFNTVLDKAPVLDLGTPGSSTGSLFVLPMPAPAPATMVAARMLISRRDGNYLALADYDMKGKATLVEAKDVEAALGYPVNSSALGADGQHVILGTPKYAGGASPTGRVSILTIGSKPDGTPAFGLANGNPGDSRLGISVATGNITGPLSEDFVAVSDNSVQLLGTDPAAPIATSPPSCLALQLGSATDFYAFRPVAVADMLSPTPGAAGTYDEIVLGGQGRVLFIQFDGTAVLPCPTKVLVPSLGADSNFGTSLAVGDFDGDGHMDLAVGDPPSNVYVYFGPLDARVDPLAAPTGYDVDIFTSTTTSFGKNIATYHLPGQAKAQLLVADPTAASPGGVGQVMLFDVLRGAAPYSIPSTAALAMLFDSNKDSDPGLLGLNLGGLEFNTSLCSPTGTTQLVPWASLGPDILTFFAYKYSGVAPPADPRCFAK